MGLLLLLLVICVWETWLCEEIISVMIYEREKHIDARACEPSIGCCLYTNLIPGLYARYSLMTTVSYVLLLVICEPGTPVPESGICYLYGSYVCPVVWDDSSVLESGICCRYGISLPGSSEMTGTPVLESGICSPV